MVTTNYTSDSDTESFHSFNDDEPGPPPSELANSEPQTHNNNNQRPSTKAQKKKQTNPAQPTQQDRFPPDEEASLLAESNTLKSSGNTLFGSGSYENAVQTYDRALASCPNYLDYEVAVLRSNVAACQLKLEEWKAAVDSATKGLECLERLEPLPDLQPRRESGREDGGGGGKGEDGGTGVVQEVDDAGEARIAQLQRSGKTLEEVRRLQVKLLQRRAKGRASVATWTSLQGADEDYRLLLRPTLAASLSPSDRRTVDASARALAPRLNAAKEREMAEMMKNLKGIGNSILKPFGLSTENFQFTKDEKTGGYSMNFEQNPGGGGEGR